MPRPPFDPSQWSDETCAVRGGTVRSQMGEHSEAMYLTSSFVFESAAQAAARFSGQEEGNVYARFTNPSVTMFEERLAQMEGAQACLATSSGMAAITTTCMGLLSQGDHIVSSKSIFGATVQLFATLLNRFGITTTFVDGTDIAQWEAAIQPNTKLFYVETPSNPLTEIIDMQAMKNLTAPRGIYLVVDNCFCTPALQKPFEWGADLVIHSATKYLDGQGRVLGGAILGEKQLLKDKILPVLRTAGPSLSAFNAWVLLKGLETLQIRMDKQSENAAYVAKWLEDHPKIRRVYYPGLPSHPQYELACRQQKNGGAIVSFEVIGDTPESGRANAWKVIDNTAFLSITANLGDTRSTITHPATTTHGRLSPEARKAAGVEENLIRIAVGLENCEDICSDVQTGLALVA